MSLAQFYKDRKAGVAPLLALAVVPIIGSVGAAVNYSRANSAKVAMQAALDAAAVIISKESLAAAGVTEKASSYFNANFARPDVQNVEIAAAVAPTAGGTSVTMSAKGSIKTEFLGMMGLPTIAITANSGAAATSDGLGCVLSLDPNANSAMSAQGSTSIVLNGCSMYDNSRSATALTVDGSARISALSVGVVGGMSGAEGVTTVQGIRTGVAPVIDPYANVAFPNFFGCNEVNFKAQTAVTINPGVYCGGMSLNAGADVTLNPGIYYLDGGDLSVNGGAALTGTSVTLVFTKKTGNGWATAKINGNAAINLTPPKSGPTAGIVMFGDRGMPVGTTFKINGGATQYLGGAIYLPTAAVDFSGGAGTGTSCTQIIGNTVSFSGNSSVRLSCSGYEIKPFSSLVVKLTS